MNPIYKGLKYFLQLFCIVCKSEYFFTYIYNMQVTNIKTSLMYFEVKAFRNGVRRFENLDNFQELQEFCAKYSELGFTKLIVKAFNCEGFKSRNFYTFVDGQYIKFYKD